MSPSLIWAKRSLVKCQSVVLVICADDQDQGCADGLMWFSCFGYSIHTQVTFSWKQDGASNQVNTSSTMVTKSSFSKTSEVYSITNP